MVQLKLNKNELNKKITARHNKTLQVVDLEFNSIEEAKKYNPDLENFSQDN